jgi:hypothetical protein
VDCLEADEDEISKREQKTTPEQLGKPEIDSKFCATNLTSFPLGKEIQK